MDITPGGMEWTEPAKRKRRRPHKYVIPGMAQLAIQAPGTLPAASPQTPGTEKRGRGRPPGSGKKQQLGAFTAGSFTLTFEEVFDLCSFNSFFQNYLVILQI
jgi:hypothetical protein